MLNLICVIICRVVINADAPYIKMVSEQFDRCHGTLLQYVEFLCSAMTPAAAYAQQIPSLNDLVHLYHLDPEVCLAPSECVCVIFSLLLLKLEVGESGTWLFIKNKKNMM